MSLINKMLNELEKNRKKIDPVRLEILSSMSQTIKKYNLPEWIDAKKFLFGLLAIALIVVTVFLAHKFTSKHIKKHKHIKKSLVAHKTVPKPVVTIKPIVAAKPAAILKQIILQPISEITANKKTSVDFILSAPAIYYIEHNADQKQISIIFTNTSLVGNVPVSLENSFIAALDTKQNAINTVCTLTLLPGTKIDESRFVAVPEPMLHLELSNPELVEDSKMLKTPVLNSEEQDQDQRYEQIQQLLAQNNIKEAITQLYWFTADFVNYLPAQETLVALLIKNHDLHKADNALRLSLNKNPSHLPFVKLKARILIEQGDNSAALSLLQKYSISFADDCEYLALLAFLYQKQGQFIPAARLYNKLTKLEPQKSNWWLGLGLALESAGKKNAAKEAYRHVYGE